jgi:imidazolonepropionase-like amidohydrolase/Tol biopolymer transport system component
MLSVRAAMAVAAFSGISTVAASAVQKGGAPSPQEFTISVDQGTWMNVDVSPDGRRIAFDMLGDIYVMPATGGAATPILSGSALQLHPRFSPDGKKIAFISDASGSENLWIANSDGSGAVQVSKDPSSFISSPSWRQDGKALIIRKAPSTQTGYKFGDLYVHYLDGNSGLKIVDAAKDVDDGQFSADAGSIYHAQDVTKPGTQMRQPLEANIAIKRLDLKSGNTSEVARGYGSALVPRLSPSGDKIAFVRRVRTKSVLFVLDLETGSQTPVFDGLTRDSQSDPLAAGPYPRFGWFPDNKSIAIWAKGKILKINTETLDASQIPFTARATHKISPVLRYSNPIGDSRFTVRTLRGPVASRDGNTVIFSALGKLWRKSGDDTPVPLTAEDALEYDPSLRADGRELVYVSWSDEAGAVLKTVSLKGGSPRVLHRSNGILKSPSYSTDGRQIAFAITKPDGNVGGHSARPGLYVIEARGGKPLFVTSEGARPKFSLSGERIFYALQSAWPGGLALKSVTLDGLDAREHVTAPNAVSFEISPDERWLAFEETSQVYVAPFPPKSLALTGTTTELPVRSVGEPGSEPHWSSSNRIHWLLGDRRYGVAVDELFGTQTVPKPAAAPLGLEAEVDKPKGVVAFVGGRIITMAGDEIIEDGVLIVEGPRIKAVGTRANIAVPPGALVVDVRGKTLMPGFIDAHAHAHLSTSTTPPQKFPPYYANLAFGVTSLFDPSAGGPSSFERAEMVKAGTVVGPRIFSVGPILLGLTGGPPYSPIKSVADAERQLLFRHAYGTPYVKSYVQPTRSQRQKIIEAARQHEMMVFPEGMMHYFYGVSMILDGHTTLEHGIPLPEVYDDIVQLTAKAGVALTPTITVAAGAEMGEQYFFRTEKIWENEKVQTFVPEVLDIFAGFRPAYLRSTTIPSIPEEMYDIGYRALSGAHKKLNDAGVLVNSGAHGHFPGVGLHWEVWMMHQGGMSNLQALRTATINPAITLGLDGDIGSIAPGKLADLVVLDGDPLKDIKATMSVRYTMANGRLYDSATMNEIGHRPRPRSKFYWELPGASSMGWRVSDLGPRGE